jgi:ribosomal protein S12 methylthiotransferase
MKRAYIYVIAAFMIAFQGCQQPVSVKYPETKKVDVKDDYHGTIIEDPYRWLEDDKSEETAKWVEEQNKVTFGYLEQIPFREKIKNRLTELWDYPKYSVTFKKGDRYFYFKNEGMQNQSVLYVQESLDAEPRLLLDPNTLSEDGTVALSNYSVSKDGKYLAYGISRGGSDWNEIFVMEIESEKKLDDHLKWIKFSGISWKGDGFYYSRYDEPTGSELSSKNEFHKVFYHEINTPQDQDILVFENKDFPLRNFGAGVTDDENFLIIYESESTSGNSLYVKDFRKPNSVFEPIVENFDNDYSVIDHYDGKLLVLTNYDAKEESIDTILNFVNAKQQGIVSELYVMGCLSERYRHELSKEIPEVDGFFGVSELQNILRSVGADYRKELLGERHLTTPNHYAYLKISEGCDRKCSFCAIPLIRGKHQSKTIEEILNEAKYLASVGVKELILIAQDTTYYGLDIYGKRRLPDLLQQLTLINGIEWIRLHYAYPNAFPEKTLSVINSSPKICKYLDIPIQHISDPILKAMKRSHSNGYTRKLIEKIRNQIPGVALRTSIIVGFPGETNEQFDELKNFISEVKFDRLGVFTYSHEENTKAYKLKDDISAATKRKRASELMALQQQISFDINRKKIGTSLRVIIDRKDGDFWIGRSEFDSPEVDNEILIPSTFPLKEGSLVKVKITDAEAFDLFAMPV